MVLRLILALFLSPGVARAEEARDLAHAAARCAGFLDAGLARAVAEGSDDRQGAEEAAMYLRAARILLPEPGSDLVNLREAAARSFRMAGTTVAEDMAQNCQNLGLRLRDMTGIGFH